MTNEQRARAALKKLIEQHNDANGKGGSRRLAEALGVKRQAVEAWDLIPLTYIRQTVKLYGLGLADLRPDVMELARLK